MRLRFGGTTDALLQQLQGWENEVRGLALQLNPGLADEIGFRTTVPLNLLPVKQRQEFLERYRGYIGLDETLQAAAGGPISASGAAGAQQIFDSPAFTRSGGMSDRAPFLRANVADTDNSLMGHIYRGLNIQFKQPGRSTDPFAFFNIGTRNIPSVTSLRQSMEMATKLRSGQPIMDAGSRFMVFDLETAGLQFGQIREMSFSAGTVQPSGNLRRLVSGTQHFRSAAFARGMMAVNGGEATTMEEFMRRKFGVDYSTQSFGDGGDFARRMMPMLDQMNQAKYILGHNISKFDMQQIFVGLAGTGAYKNNEVIGGRNFRDLVDNVWSTSHNKIVDTLDLARSAPNLQSITTAPEFARRGGRELFSNENLLLQTNLLDLAPDLKGMLFPNGTIAGSALHGAAIDQALTARLVELLPQLTTANGGLTDPAMRSAIASGGALTPITKITNANDISDSLLRHMIARGDGIEGESPYVRALLDRAKTDPKAAEEAMRMLRSGAPARYNVNPIEQEIFSTRRLGLATRQRSAYDEIDTIMNLGEFDRMTGRRIPYGGIIRRGYGMMRKTSGVTPTLKEFEMLQARLARAGMPYAGLSFEERKFGTSLSALTAKLSATTTEQNAARIGADTLISRFSTFDPANMQYLTASAKRTTVGLHLAQSLGVAGDDSFLRLSGFKYAAPIADGGERYGINLVYNFADEAEAERLSQGVLALAGQDDDAIMKALGISNEYLHGADAISNFRSSAAQLAASLTSPDAMEYGISVGQIHDQKVARSVYELLEETMGGRVSDYDQLDFLLPLINAEFNETGGTGTIRVGAPTLSRFMDQADRSSLIAQSHSAYKYFHEAITPIASKFSTNKLAQTILTGAVDDKGVNGIMKAYRYYENTIRPRAPYAIAGAAVLGLAGFIAGKRREQNQYDVALQQMPFEESSQYALHDQVNERLLMGTGSPGKRMDPLATASVIDNLYANRMNHTSMSWDKNTALYGGVL